MKVFQRRNRVTFCRICFFKIIDLKSRKQLKLFVHFLHNYFATAAFEIYQKLTWMYVVPERAEYIMVYFIK